MYQGPRRDKKVHESCGNGKEVSCAKKSYETLGEGIYRFAVRNSTWDTESLSELLVRGCDEGAGRQLSLPSSSSCGQSGANDLKIISTDLNVLKNVDASPAENLPA